MPRSKKTNTVDKSTKPVAKPIFDIIERSPYTMSYKDVLDKQIQLAMADGNKHKITQLMVEGNHQIWWDTWKEMITNTDPEGAQDRRTAFIEYNKLQARLLTPDDEDKNAQIVVKVTNFQQNIYNQPTQMQQIKDDNGLDTMHSAPIIDAEI